MPPPRARVWAGLCYRAGMEKGRRGEWSQSGDREGNGAGMEPDREWSGERSRDGAGAGMEPGMERG